MEYNSNVKIAKEAGMRGTVENQSWILDIIVYNVIILRLTGYVNVD